MDRAGSIFETMSTRWVLNLLASALPPFNYLIASLQQLISVSDSHSEDTGRDSVKTDCSS